MIGYIKGVVTAISDDYIFLENNGIGYIVYITSRAFSNIKKDEECTFYIHMSVREDGITLYGLESLEELNLFKLLITVNGVGPKVALSILSTFTPASLSLAIISGDTKAISKANGVGAKGAGRIVMELKDKIDFEDTLENKASLSSDDNNSSLNDAVLALVSLGYSESDARSAVFSLKDAGDMQTEDIIKQALKKLF